jgi:hypothetical protein
VRRRWTDRSTWTAWATLVAALVVAAPSTAQAQRAAESFLQQDGGPNTVRLTFEMDPALAFGAGYVRTIPLAIGDFERPIGVHFDVTTILGLSSWDFAAGASMFLADNVGLNVLTTVELELKVVQNEVHGGLAYGYAAALRPGWYDHVWFASLELALHGTFAATVTHRDAYRAMFPDVQDGTYATANLAFFLGGAIGFRIAERARLGLRFAWRFPRTFESYAPYVQPYSLGAEAGFEF